MLLTNKWRLAWFRMWEICCSKLVISNPANASDTGALQHMYRGLARLWTVLGLLSYPAGTGLYYFASVRINTGHTKTSLYEYTGAACPLAPAPPLEKQVQRGGRQRLDSTSNGGSSSGGGFTCNTSPARARPHRDEEQQQHSLALHGGSKSSSSTARDTSPSKV